jgi:flavodoxin
MAKKCLIIYQSNTGNTAKVASRFKSTFEKNGWECDAVRISRKTDLGDLPSVKDYDFLCVGSPVYGGMPPEEMRMVMDVLRSPGKMEHISLSELMEALKKPGKSKEANKSIGGFRPTPHQRIALGSKKGAVFVTYSGAHFGPKEAEPALKWLEVEMEHSRFKCIGSFCCPGKFALLKGASLGTYHGDLRKRPNERDLLKAEIFIEDLLEKVGKS